MDQPVSRLTEMSLVERIKLDETYLMKHLYRAGYSATERYILQNSGTIEDAKDVYQEAFLAVWRNLQLDRFAPGNEGDFSAYLFRVAKNKWIDELRKRKNRHMVSVEEGLDERTFPVEDLDETDAYIDIVKKQYQHLGARCRELLNRFYFRKQNLSEIAAAFDWTAASAKNSKYRCLKQLRDLVLKEGAK